MEALAEQSLRSEGFPTFFPYHSVRTANRQTRIEPLFRRYGFAQPNSDQQWVGMLYARGVAAVIRNPYGVPKPVPPTAIETLLAQCSADGIIHPVEPASISKGQRAKVMDGPLSEMSGVCTRSSKERVWLLLSVMGRDTEVGMSRRVVEAA